MLIFIKIKFMLIITTEIRDLNYMIYDSFQIGNLKVNMLIFNDYFPIFLALDLI